MNLVMGRHISEIDWRGVPAAFKGYLSAVCRSEAECADLVKWFGDADFCPFLPVMVMVPPPRQPVLIPGHGYATAAELQDCALVAWHGKALNFDERRERFGLMRREDAGVAISEAITDRIARHKASPITDPFRQPQYVMPNERTLHTVAKIGANE